MDMKSYTNQLLMKIRKSSPLVHNITNFVVMNSSANILLALGASPVMAHCITEVEEMTAMANALVLNIGTLDENWVESMILAAKTANSKNIPVILDPVGAGATTLRTKMSHKIIQETKISVIRGNTSEILSLVSRDVKTRGVDSSLSVDRSMIETAKKIALEMKSIIAISGKEDIITDGKRTFCVANGHPIMTRVTGIGCGLTAIVGAFCAEAEGDFLQAATAAHAFYGLCGDLAYESSQGPGSFFITFLDLLYSAGEKEISAYLQVKETS
jgi:hydroxyethylthiazole kinase